MTECTAKKVILKTANGDYVIPFTVPYTAGSGISITDNVISATGGSDDTYTKEEIDSLISGCITNGPIAFSTITPSTHPMPGGAIRIVYNLSSNCIYSITSSIAGGSGGPTRVIGGGGSLAFNLPTPSNADEFNQILVQLNLKAVAPIYVGTTYFFNKTAPDLSNIGVYNLIWEYDKANEYWVCGLLSKGAE